MIIIPRMTNLIVDKSNNRMREYLLNQVSDENIINTFIYRWTGYEISRYFEYETKYTLAKIKGEDFIESDANKLLYDWCMTDFASVYYNYIDYYTQRINVYNAMYPSLSSDEVKAKLETLLKTTTTIGSKGMVSDLPNKQLSEDKWYDYPSTTDKNDSTTETDDSTMMLSMYRAYMGGLRNIYLEFAEKFSDCVMHTFSGGDMEWYTQLS